MRVLWLIARRYFFSRQIKGVVHVISGISLLAITVGTFALITVLSVFNGFEALVSQLFNTFDSDLKLLPEKGKYFVLSAEELAKIRGLEGVMAVSPIIEENALFVYRDNQTVGTFKAMLPEFLPSTGIDTMIRLGEGILAEDGVNYSLVGADVATKLKLPGIDEFNPVQIYLPKRGRVNTLDPTQSFHIESVNQGGIFSTLQEFDSKYMLIPLSLGSALVEQDTAFTSYEVNLASEQKRKVIQQEIAAIVGEQVKVLDRFQQQPTLYKVMRSEKLGTYLILTFILLIAAFNLTGALMILAIEKQRDAGILQTIGLTVGATRRIILMDGLLYSVGGGLVGLLLGTVICYLQQQYGFVPISSGESTFVVKAFPVRFKVSDFFLVLVTVTALGALASWYPARNAFRLDTVRLLKGRRG